MTACKTSSQLFAAARDAQTERAGARVKVRLPNALHRDITACAAACRIPLADWTAARATSSTTAASNASGQKGHDAGHPPVENKCQPAVAPPERSL